MPEVRVKKYPPFYFIAGWALIAILYSFYRSFWCDEFVRLIQNKLGFTGALKAMLLEPGPYSFGENVLNWVSWVLFSRLLPEEVWARLPTIIWGCMTLALGLSMVRKKSFVFPNASFYCLPAFLFFSVSLLSFATEMRPYASLVYAGALCSYLLMYQPQQAKKDRTLDFLIVFTLLFTQIYGICYLVMVCIFRKRFLQALLGVLYLGFILYCYRHNLGKSFAQTATQFPTLLEMIKQISGTLGNPQKSSFFFAPAALLGFWSIFKKKPLLAVEFFLLLFASIIAPILASALGKYFFVPRQCLGGVFPFLMLASLGVATLTTSSLPAKVRKAIPIAAVVCFGVIPWVVAVVLMLPPFPDQPRHEFREVAEEVIQKGYKNVFITNPCNRNVFEYYLEKTIGQRHNVERQVTLNDQHLDVHCWNEKLCVYTFLNFQYCSLGIETFAPDTKQDTLLRQSNPRMDLVVHGFLGYSPEGIQTRRDW